jgi:hypothetical protein
MTAILPASIGGVLAYFQCVDAESMAVQWITQWVKRMILSSGTISVVA